MTKFKFAEQFVKHTRHVSYSERIAVLRVLRGLKDKDYFIDGDFIGEIEGDQAIVSWPGDALSFDAELVQDESDQGSGTTDDKTAEETTSETDADSEETESGDPFQEISGVGADTARALREHGFETLEDIDSADATDLEEVTGVGPATAEQIKANVEELI